jgi:hypothetical protein
LAYDAIVGKRQDAAAIKLGRRGGLKRIAMLTSPERTNLARRAAAALATSQSGEVSHECLPSDEPERRIRPVDVLLDEYAKGYRLNHRPKSVTLVEGRAADLKRLTANPLPTHLIEARGRVNWKSGAIVAAPSMPRRNAVCSRRRRGTRLAGSTRN